MLLPQPEPREPATYTEGPWTCPEPAQHSGARCLQRAGAGLLEPLPLSLQQSLSSSAGPSQCAQGSLGLSSTKGTGRSLLGTGNWKCAFLLRDVISLGSTCAVLHGRSRPSAFHPRELRVRPSVLPAFTSKLTPPPLHPCTLHFLCSYQPPGTTEEFLFFLLLLLFLLHFYFTF